VTPKGQTRDIRFEPTSWKTAGDAI